MGVNKWLLILCFRHFVCYIATFTSFRETCSKLMSNAEIPLLGKRFHQTWFQLKCKFLLSSHCQAFQKHCGVSRSKKVLAIYHWNKKQGMEISVIRCSREKAGWVVPLHFTSQLSAYLLLKHWLVWTLESMPMIIHLNKLNLNLIRVLASWTTVSQRRWSSQPIH